VPPVLDQEFAVAEIMQVPAGASLRNFPDFPRAGSLVILSPPSRIGAKALNGLMAQVAIGARTVTLRYAYWQVNSRDEIGLLCDKLDEATIPLGSKVTFVKRRKT
jgi:hypothetical protein